MTIQQGLNHLFSVEHDQTFRVLVQDGSLVAPWRSSGRVDEGNVDQVKERGDEDKVEAVAETGLSL